MPFQITTEWGYAIPPAPHHAITIHAPGWDSLMKFRDGDPSMMSKIRSIYPRLFPVKDVKALAVAISQKLEMPPTNGVLVWTSSDSFNMVKNIGFHPSFSKQGQEIKLLPEDLTFKVVDIYGVRLYLVFYPIEKTPAIIGTWQHPGIGISTRLAEELMKNIDTMKEIEFSGSAIPPATWLPEGPSHAKLRERISDLLYRSPIDMAKVKVNSYDIYLYPSGMAAIYYLQKGILNARPATSVPLGSVFHNTWKLFNSAPSGMKHFGHVDRAGLDQFEEYLKTEAKEGRKISYVFIEFPSNPVLVSADLHRLKKLADQYDFILVVDETIGSFCNIDLMQVADVVVTSLTKSFSGYSDVLGGSVVLNSLSPRYSELKEIQNRSFHNEFFIGDADVMLANSNDYLERSTVLNRNAAAIATYLQTQVSDPTTSVKKVFHPMFSDSRDLYELFMRPSTPDFTPGYGCLLSVEFETLEQTIAFFDHLGWYHGPHLGAHKSLAFPYHAIIHGKNPKDAEYHASYGCLLTQVRLAPGLEPEEDLIELVKIAQKAADEIKTQGK